MTLKRILITGASGFVGHSCAKTLQETNQYDVCLAVRSLDKLQVDQHDFARVPVGELSLTTRWEQALHHCDCVIHTAGRAHVMKENASNPLKEYRRVNVDGTLNLAKQAIDAGVRRFIFLSSIKVNGENSGGNPFRVEDKPSPKDPYGQSKHEAEEALRDLAKKSPLEVVIIRPPLIYGPGVKGNFRIMLQWLQKGYPIPVPKTMNKRSFVGLKNLIDLIQVCISHPNAANETFLISDGYDLSTTELFKRIGECMNKPARLLHAPFSGLSFLLKLAGKQSALDRLYGALQVDIEKNKKTLDWTPTHDFSSLLAETVHAYLNE
jgi:nucleoside-diphosphate-sugar epimerase